MRNALPFLLLMTSVPFAAQAQAQTKAETVYFAMIDRRPAVAQQEFIFGVTDPEMVRRIRELGLHNGGRDANVITGRVKRGREPYNPAWNFHIVPETVGSGAAGIIECDAAATTIEDHIDRIGVPGLLPRFHWCPWGMKVIREVKPILD